MEEYQREEGLRGPCHCSQPLPARAPTFLEELPVLQSHSLPPPEGLLLRLGQSGPPVSCQGHEVRVHSRGSKPRPSTRSLQSRTWSGRGAGLCCGSCPHRELLGTREEEAACGEPVQRKAGPPGGDGSTACRRHQVASVVSDSVQPHGLQPTRLLCPWDSPGKNTGVGCHFLLQCVKVESESEVTQSCLTLRDPMDCSPPGSSVHRIFQARVLEWGAIAFSSTA